jgi:hypothetical protein
MRIHTSNSWVNDVIIVPICTNTCYPFLISQKGLPISNPVGVQTRTFSESKEQKKVCKSTTYTLFEQLRTVFSGKKGKLITTPNLLITSNSKFSLAKGTTPIGNQINKLGDLTFF